MCDNNQCDLAPSNYAELWGESGVEVVGVCPTCLDWAETSSQLEVYRLGR